MLSFWSMSDQGRSWRSLFTFTVIIYWKDWCWSWSSTMLATRCEEPTLWKRPWCWERLKARGESGDRGWDSWMESLTQWTWVWANSGRWWRKGKPGMLQFMGLQRVGHDLVMNSKNNNNLEIKGAIFGRSHKLFWSYWPSLRNKVSLSLSHFQLISSENRPLHLHSWPRQLNDTHDTFPQTCAPKRVSLIYPSLSLGSVSWAGWLGLLSLWNMCYWG